MSKKNGGAWVETENNSKHGIIIIIVTKAHLFFSSRSAQCDPGWVKPRKAQPKVGEFSAPHGPI